MPQVIGAIVFIVLAYTALMLAPDICRPATRQARRSPSH
jgi:hypothetical protein